MMELAAHQRIARLLEHEFLRRNAEKSSIEFKANSEGVKAIPDDTLLAMVIASLILRSYSSSVADLISEALGRIVGTFEEDSEKKEEEVR